MTEVVWCVYLHKRPDGSVFYIGKGRLHRAYDFAASRRTLWHRNIVAKYGRKSIGVEVIACSDEEQAFAKEREQIALAREKGESLANLTNGGEGAAGRKPTEKQLVALAKGRVVGKRGVSGARPQLDVWRLSAAGQEHQKRVSQIGKMVLHTERSVICAECHEPFATTSAKAKCCSRLCEQRYRRAGKNK